MFNEHVQKMEMFNDQQRLCFNETMRRVYSKHIIARNGILINAPSGTGKSFLLNTLIEKVYSEGKLAMEVSSSGIAATVLLIHSGRAEHNLFMFPLNEFNEIKACSTRKKSEMAKIISLCELIVWDMADRTCMNTLSAVDFSIRHILENDLFMGGKVFVCAGDFRSLTPVARGGGRGLPASKETCYFWDYMIKLELIDNVRQKAGEPKYKEFAQLLSEMGSSKPWPLGLPGKFGMVMEDKESVVDKVYGDIKGNELNSSYFERRCILTHTSDDADDINRMVLAMNEYKEYTYWGEDTPEEENVGEMHVGVHNGMNTPGIPPQELKLKVGCVVMVMRNICPPSLSCGTRLMVTNLVGENLVIGKILGGTYSGHRVFITRITVRSTDGSIKFKRNQFPLRLCYAMTSNMSKGQMFDKCGLILDTCQCLSLVQRYVAFSMLTKWDSLYIYTGCQKQFKELSNVHAKQEKKLADMEVRLQKEFSVIKQTQNRLIEKIEELLKTCRPSSKDDPSNKNTGDRDREENKGKRQQSLKRIREEDGDIVAEIPSQCPKTS